LIKRNNLRKKEFRNKRVSITSSLSPGKGNIPLSDNPNEPSPTQYASINGVIAEPNECKKKKLNDILNSIAEDVEKEA